MYKLHTSKQEKYFKEVIRLYYKEGYSKSQICTKLPIDRKTIFRWISMYEQTPVMFMPESTDDASKTAPRAYDTDYILELEQKVEELERKTVELEVKLNYETLRADLYNKMIEITETKFNIQIRSNTDNL